VDEAESPAGWTGIVRGSVDFLDGGADFPADRVDGPLGCAVDVDDFAGVVFAAGSSADGRALPFTANELS